MQVLKEGSHGKPNIVKKGPSIRKPGSVKVSTISNLKLLLCSDLHTEYQHDRGRSLISKLPKDVDVVVIAGDWVPFSRDYAEEAIRNFTEAYPNVVSIQGNHELYRSSYAEVNQRIEYIHSRLPSSHGNWYPLDKSTVTIEGVTFAGATTWFPDTPESRLYQAYINDFGLIRDFNPWVYQENAACVEFWEETNADVWVSHHFPQQSVSHWFKGDKLNCYFVEPALDGLIGYKQPKLFLHGHTHSSHDYYIGKTRVVCNPYGYETHNGKALNREFRYDCILEVEQ